jgi:hypothetical protein
MLCPFSIGLGDGLEHQFVLGPKMCANHPLERPLEQIPFALK